MVPDRRTGVFKAVKVLPFFEGLHVIEHHAVRISILNDEIRVGHLDSVEFSFPGNAVLQARVKVLKLGGRVTEECRNW